MQPSSQGILLDTFPPEKQGAAQTVFGVAALIAPVLGPTLGGYITDQYSWRWIFYINLPVGRPGLLLLLAHGARPGISARSTCKSGKRPLRLRFIGLGLLVVALVCWEVLLSKGQEWDWLGDPFGRVQTLVILFILGGMRPGLLGDAALQSDRQFSPSARPQFAISCLVIFCCVRRALRFQHLAARDAGIALRLRCFSRRAGLVAGRDLHHHRDCHRRRLLGRGVDARWLIGAAC